MKRGLVGLLVFLGGCSTAPVADFLDYWFPGRYRAGAGQPHGGVCLPQGGTPGAPRVGPGNVPLIAAPQPVPVIPGPQAPGGVIPPPQPPPGSAVVPGAGIPPPPAPPGGPPRFPG